MFFKRFTTTVLILLAVCMATNLYAESLETLGCMLEPSKKVNISSPVSGVIDLILVKRGDNVKKGDVLLRLKAGIETASVEMAKAKKEFAERNVHRNQELYNEQLLSPHEKDEIETELLMADMELRLKREELTLRTVYSPISGVVVDRFRDNGEYVNTEPVLSLAKLDPLHVDLLLPSHYFGSISKKQELLVKPELKGFESRRAVVTIVDPLIDPASGTFRVRLDMKNPALKLPAGMRCSVELITDKKIDKKTDEKLNE